MNGDGSITTIDGLAVLSRVVGKTLPGGYRVLPNGDADDNGEVTALDALLILAYVVGRDVSPHPVGKPVETGVRLVIAGGDGQTGTVGQPPADFLRVRAVTPAGRGVRGIRVARTATQGGGSIRALEEVTVGFSAPGLAPAQSGMVTVTPGAPASLAIQAGDGQTAAAGSAVAADPAVIVRDASGNPVPGVSVTFAVASGGGSATDATPTTDAGGIATVGAWTLGTTVGANTLSASAGGLTPVAFNATGVAGQAAAIYTATTVAGAASTATSTLSANPASITADSASTSTLTVQLRDAHGNSLTASGGTVALSTTGGTLSPVADNGNGSYTATLTSPKTTGSATVGGTLNGSALAATATVAFVPGAPARYVVTRSADTVTAGSPVTVTAQLVDANGNHVPTSGRTVAWSSTGGGSFASPTSTTDAAGVATVVFTTSTTSGTAHTVTASDGTVSGTSGGVQTTPGAPASITKSGSDGVSLAAGSTVTPPPAVRITDATGWRRWGAGRWGPRRARTP